MSEPYTILIIDDSPDDLEFYSTLLSRSAEGHRVLTALSPSQGFELCAQNKIDCLLVDFNMPEATGLEVLEKIVMKGPADMAVILLTGQPRQSIQAEAARKGAYDFLVKDAGMSSDELDLIVTKCVRKARELALRKGKLNGASPTR